MVFRHRARRWPITGQGHGRSIQGLSTVIGWLHAAFHARLADAGVVRVSVLTFYTFVNAEVPRSHLVLLPLSFVGVWLAQEVWMDARLVHGPLGGRMGGRGKAVKKIGLIRFD
jgi:hypothetical protein